MADLTAGEFDADAAAKATQQRRSFEYVGPDAPAAPSAGEVWYDTDARNGDGAVKVYDGGWTETIVAVVGVAPGTEPEGPA
jgi:hypothetical protein